MTENEEDVYIEYVPPSEISGIFPSIYDWVEQALGVDKSYTPEDIQRACEDNRGELRVIYLNQCLTGFFISEIVSNPKGKVFCGAWLGGKDLDKWVRPGLAIIENEARKRGCIAYSFVGRGAWKKLIGFDYQGVYYYKNL